MTKGTGEKGKHHTAVWEQAHSRHPGRKPKVTTSHFPVLGSAENITPEQCRMVHVLPFRANRHHQPKGTVQSGTGSNQHCLLQHSELKTKYPCWSNTHIQPSLLPQKPKALAASTANAPTQSYLLFWGKSIFFWIWPWFPGRTLEAFKSKCNKNPSILWRHRHKPFERHFLTKLGRKKIQNILTSSVSSKN